MPLRVGLAQINTTVGDMRANVDTMARMIGAAKRENVDLVVFPEMCICGYPPEDLLCKPKFLTDNEAALQSLAGRTNGITAIVGLAQGSPTQCYNAAAVLEKEDGDGGFVREREGVAFRVNLSCEVHRGIGPDHASS